MEEETDIKSNGNTGTIIIKREIEDEMRQSYLDYSMSVIVGRALPDVRDGLKPVHRRILYTMYQSGLFHNKPFRKSANVVGNCIAAYHPHGDIAIYDALVRMAQNFSMRYPLIDGQGNFGSVDGDAAAAYRYTEARLTRIAEEMLHDIDKRTVKLVPNFDNSTKEPLVLPGKIPNLLINGSSGIAVGMATNIPPHNIKEVISAITAQIDNPEITSEELMEHIKGPDFPTGAVICGTEGIKNAYKTGRGKITIRAKTKIEQSKGNKKIIVTEIPYMINKAEMIIQIADLVKDKKIIGINDINDESDKDGIRVAIELKKDANEEVILNQLYHHSRLEATFGINILALVNNIPKILTLKELIHNYIQHRKDVIRKRTLYDLHKAQQKAHILEGLLIALKSIDLTIKLVKESKNPEEAKSALIKSFNLSEQQAFAILDMKLQKLTGLEHEAIKKEHATLIQLIEELESILEHPQKILNLIKSGLSELNEKYGDNRKTEIIETDISEITNEDLIKKEDMVITITHSGYIKRLPLETYKVQGRGGKGLIGTSVKEEDIVKDIFIANTHDYILFFTNKGKVYWIKVYQVPEVSRQSKGKPIINLISLTDEKITAYIPVKSFSSGNYLIMSTLQGIIKKTSLEEYSNPRKTGIIAITLNSNDELINVKLTDGTKNIILATKNGNAVKFSEKQIRATGRSSQGVRGIKLKKGDYVIGMEIANDENSLLTVTENGYGKRTQISEYRLSSRACQGVKNIQCSERNGKVVSISSLSEENEIMIITQKGIVIRIPASQISVIGRNTQGVRLIKLHEQDKVVGAAKILMEEK